jgi:hypothetical protein
MSLDGAVTPEAIKLAEKQHAYKGGAALADLRERETEMRLSLPYGRALDKDELRRMLDEASQDNKAIVLRKRLLARAGVEYAGNLVLDAVELQKVADYIDGKIPGKSGQLYGKASFNDAPVREWQ